MTPRPAAAWRVSFSRVGRHRHVDDLVVIADEDVALERTVEEISRYVRRFLASSVYDVEVQLEAHDQGRGWITCGFHSGGTFTFHRERHAGTQVSTVFVDEA